MISLYVALMIAAQPAAAPAGLENVCQFATRRGVKADTGLEAATLQHFAVKYGHVVPERTHTRWKKGLYFYVWFMFSMSGVLPDVREHFAGLRNCGQDWTGMSGRTFRDNVLPIGVTVTVTVAVTVPGCLSLLLGSWLSPAVTSCHQLSPAVTSCRCCRRCCCRFAAAVMTY